MEWLFLWPESPALSLFVLWLGSVVFLWAAREPMLQMLRRMGEGLQGGCELLGKRSQALTEVVRERSRESLLAAGTLELQGAPRPRVPPHR